MVEPHMAETPLQREAAAAAVRIAGSIWRKHPRQAEAALKAVLEAATDRRVVRDARKVLGEIRKTRPKEK